jgi:hypothetical protein
MMDINKTMMDINNRMQDVVKLRANACQDLLKMLLPPDWKTKFYDMIVKEISGSFGNAYKEAYKKIKNVGLDNYEINDMDVTLIFNIMKSKTIFYTTGNMIKLMESVKNDRNVTNHSSSNETDVELYIRALISLNNVKELVSNAYDENFEKDQKIIIDKSKYEEYRISYFKRITELQEVIIEECAASIGRDKEIKENIQKYLESSNKNSYFCNEYDNYYRQFYFSDFPFYLKFLKMSAEAGIEEAYLYYSDNILLNMSYDVEKNRYVKSKKNPYLDFKNNENKYNEASEYILKYIESGYDSELIVDSAYIFFDALYKNTGKIDAFKNLIEGLKKVNLCPIIENDKIFIQNSKSNKKYNGRYEE